MGFEYGASTGGKLSREGPATWMRACGVLRTAAVEILWHHVASTVLKANLILGANLWIEYAVSSFPSSPAPYEREARALVFASAELQADDEVLLAAVQRDGYMLKHASAEL